MSFGVRLSKDSVSVEAGSTVACDLEVTNSGSEADRFELEVEGVDAEWLVIPVPEWMVEPEQTHAEKFFFKPPRVSESLAGTYPFVVRIRSLISGERKAVQGLLVMEAFHSVSMEILPRRASVSPFRRRAHYSVTLMNLGNSEHTMQLYGADPDEECTTEFEQEQVVVGPGQQRSIALNVGSRSTRFFSGPRLETFVVSGRSLTAPSVLTSSQAQLDIRAVTSPATTIGLFLFGLIGWLWISAIPRPATIQLFVDKPQVSVGDTVDVSWTSMNANSVTLYKDGKAVLSLATTGHRRFTADKAGNLVFEAVPLRDNRAGQPMRKVIEVVEPPPTPDPIIDRCRIKGPSSVRVGQFVVLSYEIHNAKRAYIGETGEEINLNVDTRQLTLNSPGAFTYTLIAEGEGGKIAKRTFKVQAVDTSSASIQSFIASSLEMEAPGPVTLSWEVDGADQVQLQSSDGPIEIPSGAKSVTKNVDKDTRFTLKVLDAQGRSTSKSLKVKLRVPEPSPLPTTPAPTPLQDAPKDPNEKSTP